MKNNMEQSSNLDTLAEYNRHIISSCEAAGYGVIEVHDEVIIEIPDNKVR